MMILMCNFCGMRRLRLFLFDGSMQICNTTIHIITVKYTATLPSMNIICEISLYIELDLSRRSSSYMFDSTEEAAPQISPLHFDCDIRVLQIKSKGTLNIERLYK